MSTRSIQEKIAAVADATHSGVAASTYDKPLSSLWISANAGSGKTSILVARVVKLLLYGVAPERIYCITYTKAAAGEMRERIIHTLRELLVLDDAACRKKIASLLERDANDRDLTHARTLFATMLDSPFGGVQITTIHGFCQQLLKRFPLESGIPPLFSVLEDGERDILKQTARHRLFDMYKKNELSEALALLAERSSEARIQAILDTVDQQATEWNAALDGLSPEHARMQLYAHLGLSVEADANTLRTEFCASLLSDHEREVLRHALPHLLHHKNKSEQKLGTILERGLDDCSLIINDLLDHFVTEKGTASLRAFSKSAPIPELLDRIRTQCVTHVHQMATLACAEESGALILVAAAYRGLMNQLKFERRSLDYHDLIDRTSELLCGPMIGWVMRKLDHRIDHLLIDEAQDTSPAQWRIARTLVDELIATDDGIGSGGVPRSLLVVGDEKQSIFSFQGASPKHFVSEAQYFLHTLSQSNAPLSHQALRVSYRSSAEVLKLVDAVAAIPNMVSALTNGVGVPTHAVHRTDAQGSVTLHPLLIAPEIPASEPFTLPTEYTESRSAPQLLAEQIATQIKEWLDAKRLMAGDILILVHRRRPMMPALIRALEKRRIPVSGIDRLMLSQHLAVRDLLALIAWCTNLNDDLALAQVLRSPIVGISDDALRALAVGRTGSLWEAVQRCHPEQREGSRFRSEILRVAQDDTFTLLNHLLTLRHLPPYEFLTHVLEVRGTRRRFAERFGEEVHEILDELKTQAARMPSQMVPSLAWFHDWITQSERVIKREQESRSDKVRIMTVHGAKGLEAPVVILADTMQAPDLRKEVVYFAGGLPLLALSDEAKLAPALEEAKQARRTALIEEYQRLLYVALTRARDELHIYGAVNREPKASEDGEAVSWYQIVEAALARA